MRIFIFWWLVGIVPAVFGRENLLGGQGRKCGCDPYNWDYPCCGRTLTTPCTTEETIRLTTTIETTFIPVPPPCIFEPGGCGRCRHRHHHHRSTCLTVTLTSFATVSTTEVCCTITYTSTVIQSSISYTSVTLFTTGSVVIVSVSELETETLTQLSTQTQTSFTTSSTTTTFLTTTTTTKTFESFTVSRSPCPHCPRCHRRWMDCECGYEHYHGCPDARPIERPVVVSTVRYVTQTRTAPPQDEYEEYDDGGEDDGKWEKSLQEKSFKARNAVNNGAIDNGAGVDDSEKYRRRRHMSTYIVVSPETIVTTIWPTDMAFERCFHGCPYVPAHDSTVFILPSGVYQTRRIVEVISTHLPPMGVPPCVRCCYPGCENGAVDPYGCMCTPCMDPWMTEAWTSSTTSSQPLHITSTVQSMTIVLSTQTNTVYYATTAPPANGTPATSSPSHFLAAICLAVVIGFFL